MVIIPLTELQIRPIVEAALREDVRSGDATTRALIPAGTRGKVEMNFRQDGIVAGMDVARLVWETLGGVEVEILRADGNEAIRGETVLRATGEAATLLTGERVALNFAQRLSGIATLTNTFVKATEGTAARITDTRKTTPGLRLLEKYAVRCGGGSNHRFALDDMILIKDNHIALCGGIGEAVKRARDYAGHSLKIEVECDTLAQVEEAVAARADIILLDNMGPQDLRRAVGIIGGRALSEASGGINLEIVRAIAESGVDLISLGAVTHSAPSLDIGLDVEV